MKHVHIDFHFVCDHVTTGSLHVAHVSTYNQIDGVLTKPLSSSHFQLLRSKLRVLPIPTCLREAEVIDPAVKGTLNVLRSCMKFRSVKIVVVTSSMVSLTINGKPLTPDVVVDETWFSDPAVWEELKNWYALSKTLAEDATWKFAKENKIDAVTMHPGFTTGPFLQSTLNVAAEIVLNRINGSQTLANMIYRFVDVRDVVYAHIQAFEVASASGRYILVGTVRTIWENEKPPLPIYHVSNEKAKGLGIFFISLEVSLRDTVECFKEKGFLIM
ncbi:phenylacetaldehyde reductase-like [Ziziphus jujuba]|uniref:Phenylacetaldehyde reductase-like n=1 Tax=Ziziphus jujuba TaxID=326968 RepID=A0ABM4A157_ZIZJJ|nr:phenylacetaldehyde reductase-like [Ziziphus jujuba]